MRDVTSLHAFFLIPHPRLSAGTVVKATYGPEVLTKNDNYINSAADAVNENAALGMPGLTFVDLFPIGDIPLLS